MVGATANTHWFLRNTKLCHSDLRIQSNKRKSLRSSANVVQKKYITNRIHQRQGQYRKTHYSIFKYPPICPRFRHLYPKMTIYGCIWAIPLCWSIRDLITEAFSLNSIFIKMQPILYRCMNIATGIASKLFETSQISKVRVVSLPLILPLFDNYNSYRALVYCSQ